MKLISRRPARALSRRLATIVAHTNMKMRVIVPASRLGVDGESYHFSAASLC
jgi:hypothetical protein